MVVLAENPAKSKICVYFNCCLNDVHFKMDPDEILGVTIVHCIKFLIVFG